MDEPVQNEDLELYILGRLLPSEIAPDSNRAEAESEKFMKQLADLGRQQRRDRDGEERRSELRIPLNVSASLKAINPLAAGRSEIRIIDMAAGGLKLQVPEFIHPGTAIQIRLKRTIALAEVRYCHPAGAEFHVGVHLQDVFPRGAS
ncbi:MAG: PilZ domain-containing protein [Bryobacteraceae bacterium]|jgi:hypothetical protein